MSAIRYNGKNVKAPRSAVWQRRGRGRAEGRELDGGDGRTGLKALRSDGSHSLEAEPWEERRIAPPRRTTERCVPLREFLVVEIEMEKWMLLMNE